MDEKIAQKFTEMLLKIQELERRIALLEENVPKDGYYLDGCPNYVKAYAQVGDDE